ncbi:DNA (cytosine-5-)-methyltransferase [Ureibacillus sp. Re31]|uniref:Cytosine-specific methyltransferase n=1 Tax=Ureibacillus galli TaxID=2762222 RepID=A0ABR8XB36_9BACL|nr:DNA (cytosine-5-)-methyltransferase [Ureibacillus galli]MBD8026443.1 DNA (cytosine-5-)-methyltransferase [Ureibacillus galli]
MKFLDLFAGIGGFRLGMEQAGHECVGYVEWDKYARKSYEAIHDTEGEWTAHDITSVSDNDFRLLRGKVDVICGGFPCQAFSIAGKRRGFEDTRGTLFFDIARAAKQIQPQYLFLENVKGLLNHDKGNTFRTILTTLDELGYNAEWQILNSKNFGVPQNRERVFIIGHLRGGSSGREVFPIGGTNEATNLPIEIIAHREGFRRNTQVFNPSGITEALDTGQGGGRGHYTITMNRNEIKGQTDTSHCLMARDYKGIGNQDMAAVLIKEATKRGFNVATEGDSINLAMPGSKTRRGRVGKGVANTLDTSCNQGVVVGDIKCINPRKEDGTQTYQQDRIYETDGNMVALSSQLSGRFNIVEPGEKLKIRKLTPRECWRLQGFPDWAFDRAREVNSDSQLYKQAGNSVTVNVIYEIAKLL